MDHDISFRPGLAPDGSDTYTPRTVIYDLKGAFGTLRRENALYELEQQENPASGGPWSNVATTLRLPPIQPSPYQQALEQGLQSPQLSSQTVRFWSDYNHLFYHPRSIVQLNEYELNSSLMPFEKWQTGEELFANLDREFDLLDRDLRPFLEECDQLQALQIFSNIDDAWGGFTARYLERVSDELGKGCRWVFGLQNGLPMPRERLLLQSANLAQSLYGIDSSASVHIPMNSVPTSPPAYLQLDRTSSWQTAALMATVAETITLPARLRSGDPARATFEQLETTLDNDGNRRLAAASCTVTDPATLEDKPTVNGSHDARITNGFTNGYHAPEEPKLDINIFSRLMSSFPERHVRNHTFARLESLRGTWESPSTIELTNTESRDRFVDGPRKSTHQSKLLFPVLSSYPRIFSLSNPPEKLAVRTALSTSSDVAYQIRDVERMARQLISIDEREALCDGLVKMAEEYEEGWSGSDGDSDQ